MRHLIFVFLVIGSVLIFFGCQEESALSPELSQSDQDENALTKPAPNLIGTTYTPFSDETPPIFWRGTVIFRGVEYGLYFISHGPPRDFSQASPFEEDFVIHELYDEGNIYMKGWNAGVVTYANRFPDPVKFRANGKVEEAYGDFDGWQGRSVHIRGLVYWEFDENGPTGNPEHAEGTFRIN